MATLNVQDAIKTLKANTEEKLKERPKSFKVGGTAYTPDSTGTINLPSIAGPQGPQGPAGVAGATGPQGPAGAKGATGAQGVQGPAGPAGPQGPAGKDGAAAGIRVNGTTHTPGADGVIDLGTITDSVAASLTQVSGEPGLYDITSTQSGTSTLTPVAGETGLYTIGA